MAKYRITYSEPFEFNDDESRHGIGWRKGESTVFDADDDAIAQKRVTAFVNYEFKILGRTFHLRPIELVKLIQEW